MEKVITIIVFFLVAIAVLTVPTWAGLTGTVITEAILIVLAILVPKAKDE